MKILIFIFLVCNSLFAQIKVYTDMINSTKDVKNNQVFEVCEDILKEIQKQLGTKSSVKFYPWKNGTQVQKSTKHTIIYLSSNDLINDDLQTIGSILYKNFTLYGNQDYIYYIDTIEDAKETSQIYTKKTHTDIEQPLKSYGFHDPKYTKKTQDGLSKIFSKREILWLDSDWNIKLHSDFIQKDYKKIKPVIRLFALKNSILFDKNTDEKTIQEWSLALKAIKEDGTLSKIASKWSRKLGFAITFDKDLDALTVTN